jgi:putative salt-induced outer membrane protein
MRAFSAADGPMTGTRALVSAIFALSSLDAAAQDAASGSEPFSGKASLGYIATSGNTDSTSANAALSLLYELTNWRHAFDLSGIAASTDDAATAEAYLLTYEARRSFGEYNYLFTALDYKRDRFSGFAEQVSETVGYGRRLIDRERHILDAGIGVGARQSELRDGTEENDSIVRGSVDYLWTLSDTTDFEHALIVETGSTNTMTEARSALRARIVGDVALVLSYRIRANSSVPAGSASTDRFTAVSLEYAF